jgi:hypothetical protein
MGMVSQATRYFRWGWVENILSVDESRNKYNYGNHKILGSAHAGKCRFTSH